MNEPLAPLIARQVLPCLDLTRLGNADTEADIEQLCERAQSRFGPVAAVCIWPRFAALARRRLPPAISVAAVANFPDGDSKPDRALRDIDAIVQAGAQEIDLVLPWRALLAGERTAVTRLLIATRRASAGLCLKLILETGMLGTAAQIGEASRIALGEGADFLKTSTGKTPVGATAEAARVMLQAIAADARAAEVGFKASGGVRSIKGAALYLDLVRAEWGPAAVAPARFRIGASVLLDAVEAELSSATSAA